MVLEKPEGFSVSPDGTDQMDLSWQDISGEEEYRVYRFPSSLAVPLLDDPSLEFFIPLNEGGGENSSDVSGNIGSFEHYNTPVWTEGGHDKALQMNGENQGIYSDTSINPDGWTELTYEALVSVDNSRKLKFVLEGDNGAQTLKTQSYLSPTEWQHVYCILTSGASEMQIYIDNTLDASTSFNNTQLVRGNHMFAVPLSDPGHFPGEISDVRLYSRELSSNEREDNYIAEYSRVATLREDTTSFTDSGLSSTSYHYVVTGKNQTAGEGVWTEARQNSIGLTHPLDIDIRWSVKDEEVTLDFSEPNTGWDYEVERQDNEDGTWDTLGIFQNLPVTDTAPSGMDNKYEYRIRSVSQDDEVSDWTSVPIFSTPEQPTNIEVVSDPHSSTKITWTDNSQWETGFLVYRWTESDDSYSLIGASENSSFVDQSPPENEVVRYKVTAYAEY